MTTRDLSSFWDELVACDGDVHRLLALIARWASEVVGEAVVLTTVSEDGTMLDPAAVYHAEPELRRFVETVLGSASIRIGEGIAGTVAASRRPAIIPQVDAAEMAEVVAPVYRPFLEAHPVRSLVIVPMTAYGDLLGTLGAIRLEAWTPYSDEDVLALEALAERASLALADARRRPGRISPVDYEAIFRHSIDGVLFTAPDGTVIAANPAACTILGRTEPEICRLGRAGLLVTDDPRVKAAVVQRSRTGSVRAELPMRRGDGTVFIADVSSTIFASAGGELRACVIFRDVGRQVPDRPRA